MTKENSTIELLSRLRELGVELRAGKDKLRIDAPRGVLDLSLRRELSQRKAEILRFLEDSTSSMTHDVMPLHPVSRDGSLPLSFSQERLWFLSQLEPASTAYSMAGSIRLKGKLDQKALEQTLVELTRRHETLRTTFRFVDGRPEQIVALDPTMSLEKVDLCELPLQEREPEALRLAEEQSGKPFDLVSGPLFRTTLYRLDDEDHVMHVNMHHIISDYWSFSVMNREIADLYKALSTGATPQLPELPVQYADFACCQRQWLQGEVLATQLAYWKEKLGGELPTLDLPTDHPRPAVQTHRGAEESLVLPQEMVGALRGLGRSEGATLFMTLLAAFKTLLFRLTGQEDIIVGTPIAGRNRAELERLIGFFMNTMVMRTDLSGAPTFRELLRRVRETALEAYAYQDMPFERLVGELAPIRDLSRNPLFQVFFNHIVTDNYKLELPALEVEIFGQLGRESLFDMTLYVLEESDAVCLRILYNADLFNVESIEMMLEQYRNLLNQITVEPDKKITAYSFLTDNQREQIQGRRNLVFPTNAFAEFQKLEIEQSLAKRFEAQVEKYSQKLAVKTLNHEWTYEHLNKIANHLAKILLEKCEGVPTRVGLLFEQDAPMVASILGTLKAGNAYVPLDPTYPIQRLSYMVEDSKAEIVLTNDLNLPLAKKLTGGSAALINIDDFDFSETIDNVSMRVGTDRLAYILYTSGSTGRPKGVMQNHRNVLHFIRVYTNALHISHEDRLTLISSYSFDAAVMDIFGALLNGATLYPINIREEGLFDLSSWLIEEEISIYHSTPTVYRAFIDTVSEAESDVFPQMRLIILGGEAVYKRDVDSYKRHFGAHCLFVNGLGPTESTVSVQYFLDKKTEVPRNRIPIGYAVEDTEILLLNRYGMYDDVRGEIAIRSPYVALGYWDKPAETENGFLSDPSGGERRVYRTGDLGRRLPNGSLEFLGRKDFQVKIRGYRIETAEIENNLLEHPEIKGVSVVGKIINGESRLVAYIVTHKVQTLDDLNLRHFLQAKLPSYMIPSSFVKLDQLPLTPTKKIDRKALEQLEAEFRDPLSSDYDAAPQTSMEKLIAKIWEELLTVEHVGIYDNFFDLGGHSLLSMRVVSKIEKAAGVRINPKELIYQTLEQLASTCEKSTTFKEHEAAPKRKISGESREPYYFGSQGKPLFGCYHLPQAGTARECGIVLCYPMGNEYIKSHRSFLQLAVRLSNVGFPVMRFDYYGTGDSPGDCEQGNIVRWVGDIAGAAEELKKRTGLSKVCLIGLRLGGSLSIIAADERNDIDSLVLWDPIVSGEAYISELAKLQKQMLRFSYAENTHNMRHENLIEILGFYMHRSLFTDLAKINLLEIQKIGSNKILLIQSNKNGNIRALRDHLTKFRTAIAYQEIKSPPIWLEKMYKGLVPHKLLDSVVSWISEVYP